MLGTSPLEGQDQSQSTAAVSPLQVPTPFPWCGLHMHDKSKIQALLDISTGFLRAWWVDGVLENLLVQSERQPEKVLFFSSTV